MAKRRKLEVPSSEDMTRIEEEFRRETSRSGIPPIAQVAAEAAEAHQSGTPDQRAARARDEQDASAWREAADKGRVILEIPLDQIEPLATPRDRSVIDKDALEEMEHSISIHGVRLPIEVSVLTEAVNGRRYGLISGYRRLIAQRNLHSRTGEDGFATIRAIVRDPDQMGGAFVAMVEENEIRQNLSHYERGRISVIGAQQGAFQNTEEAVNSMFASASKAKRSKIRSFAMIFEELGDVLTFPESLREKDGLTLAQALRGGAAERLREALGSGQAIDPRSEWELIEAALKSRSEPARDRTRGGRPKTDGSSVRPQLANSVTTSTGITMHCERDSRGYLLRFSGEAVSEELMNELMMDIQRKLEAN